MSAKRKWDDEGSAHERVTLPVTACKSHFERFFLLAVDIRVNEDCIELDADSKHALQHKISRQSSKVSCELLLDAATTAGKTHGVGRVARLGCGRFPVFEVDFNEPNDVHTFLTALQRRSYQDQLAALLRERALSEMDSLNVAIKLFLAIPVRNNDADLIEVNIVNYKSCLATLLQGAKFDYWSVLSKVEVSITKEVLEVHKHLSTVVELTSDVEHWYSLGVFLRVSEASLQRLKQEYSGYTREGLVEMLRMWLETGQATWSDLVHSLCKVGHTSLARRIAAEIGWITDSLLEREANYYAFQQNTEEVMYCQEKLKEQEIQIMQSQKELKDTRKEQKMLFSRLVAMEKRLQDVTDKAAELVCEKKDLQVVLSNKEEQRQEVMTLREKAERQEVLLSILTEIERSVHEIKEQIELLELKIQELNTEETELKGALESKQKELAECQRALKAREEELFKANTEMKTERQVFDLKLQLVTVSGEKREAEQTAQIALLKEEMRKKDSQIGNLERIGAYVSHLEQQHSITSTPQNIVIQGPVGVLHTGSGDAHGRNIDLTSRVPFGQSSGPLHEKFRIEGDSLPLGWLRHTSHFILIAEESDESPISVPTSIISCYCLRAPPISFTISEAGLGKYKVSYCASTYQNVYQVRITVNNMDIRGSPFKLRIVSSIHPEMKGQPLQSISGINCPLSVAVSSSGKIVVSQNNADSITVLWGDGTYIHSVGSRGEAPGQFTDVRSIALTPDDHIVVADGGKKNIQLFSMDGRCITPGGGIFKTPQLQYPSGVAVHPNGCIYVVDNAGNSVSVFSPDLHFQNSFGRYGTKQGEFLAPCGIAIGRDGKVFVADSGNNRVQVFSSFGHFIAEFRDKGAGGQRLSDPVGIAADASHYVYVGEGGADTVSVFDTDGRFINSFGRGGDKVGRLISPAGLATDGSGNLFVCDYGNSRLVVF